jgi:lysophospholipase
MTLIATKADPIPAGATVEWLRAADGTRIRAARWCPDSATLGTVVILNGRTEFIEKYFEVIGNLLERGYAVASLDWRGQGLSDRPLANRHKGHVVNFDLYVSDLHQVMNEFIAPACPRPFRALSHSMGGNITLRYLHQHSGVFTAAAFSAPMWGIGKAARPGTALRAFSALTNAIGLGRSYVPGAGGDYDDSAREFEDNPLTHDAERFARFVAQIDAEPRLELGAPTLGWGGQAIRSMDLTHAEGFAEAISIPIRVCSAGADALVSVAAQTLLCQRLPNAKQIVIPEAKHELLMEIDTYRKLMFAAFDEL